MRPLTMTGRVTGWAAACEWFVFLRETFRQRIHGKGDGVGKIGFRAHGERINSRREVPGILDHACRREDSSLSDWTVVCAPAGPPSGKMPVINGSSPAVMR